MRTHTHTRARMDMGMGMGMGMDVDICIAIIDHRYQLYQPVDPWVNIFYVMVLY